MKTSIPHCQHCKEKNIALLHVNSRTKIGRISYMCRTCTTIRLKKYRHTPTGKSIVYSLNYARAKGIDRIKQNARCAFNQKFKRDGMKKLPCIICGEKKVDGHHEDYSKPHEVIWLCRLHHLALHKQKNRVKLYESNELH